MNVGGYSVRVEGPSESSPLVEHGFSDNYWGTDDPDSIDAWIFDHNDTGVAPYAIVGYVPYSGIPVPTKKTTQGSLRRLFR